MVKVLNNFFEKYLIPERVNQFWIIYYTVGVIGLTIPYTRQLFRELTGLSILISAVLIFLFHHPWNNRFIVACLLIFSAGFFIEAIGVNTGCIFGEYQYGKILGPKILKTPILIGLNWCLLIYIVWQLVNQISTGAFVKLLLGSTIMVGYDLFLEPIASAIGIWNWESESVTIQNYLAWFFISFVFLNIFKAARTKYNNPVALILFAAQIAFFVLLNIINQISGI